MYLVDYELSTRAMFVQCVRDINYICASCDLVQMILKLLCVENNMYTF